MQILPAVIHNICVADGDDGEHLRSAQAAIQRVERARAEADAQQQAEQQQNVPPGSIRYAPNDICPPCFLV